MIDSEEYPFMTVGELARALRVLCEFVYAHAHELGDLLASSGCQQARVREVRRRSAITLIANLAKNRRIFLASAVLFEPGLRTTTASVVFHSDQLITAPRPIRPYTRKARTINISVSADPNRISQRRTKSRVSQIFGGVPAALFKALRKLYFSL